MKKFLLFSLIACTYLSISSMECNIAPKKIYVEIFENSQSEKPVRVRLPDSIVALKPLYVILHDTTVFQDSYEQGKDQKIVIPFTNKEVFLEDFNMFVACAENLERMWAQLGRYSTEGFERIFGIANKLSFENHEDIIKQLVIGYLLVTRENPSARSQKILSLIPDASISIADLLNLKQLDLTGKNKVPRNVCDHCYKPSGEIYNEETEEVEPCTCMTPALEQLIKNVTTLQDRWCLYINVYNVLLGSTPHHERYYDFRNMALTSLQGLRDFLTFVRRENFPSLYYFQYYDVIGEKIRPVLENSETYQQLEQDEQEKFLNLLRVIESNISTINLSKNAIEILNLNEFPPRQRHYPTRFDVSHNKIKNYIVPLLPPGEYLSIYKLDLSHNNLDDEHFIVNLLPLLHAVICSITINISNNNFKKLIFPPIDYKISINASNNPLTQISTSKDLDVESRGLYKLRLQNTNLSPEAKQHLKEIFPNIVF
jgi:hypothetical protein